MKKVLLAALTVLSLSVAVAPLASAAVSSNHKGPHDNIANNLGGRYIGGSDGV
jgi:hypothetical protein